MIKKTICVLTAFVTLGMPLANAAVLSVGSTGGNVSQLQSWLIGNGYTIPLIEDGIAKKGFFGPQTRDAVLMYQEDKGLSLTGEIDSSVISSEPKVGAVATLDNINSPYLNINGVRQYFYNQNMTATSSGVCSLPNPFGATSTVAYFAINIVATGNLGAVQFDLSTSTYMNGSSSPAFMKAVTPPVGASTFFWTAAPTIATTTTTGIIGLGTNGVNLAVLGPTDFLNVRLSTSTPSAYLSYWTGTCRGQILRN